MESDLNNPPSLEERQSPIQQDDLLDMYKVMLKIRKFEEKVGELISQGEIKTPCHLYIGQEAIAVGVCHALRKDDYVFSTHRSHGHYIAKGGDLNKLMAELFCKSTGCSRGKGGSMHLASPEMGLPGSSAIVAGTIPIAVGAALAFSLQKRDSVSVAFFGDGATNEGTFYESLNFAALKKLPVIFICENNFYSTHMPIAACLADTNISAKAKCFGIPGIQIDGNDIIQIHLTARHAIELARNGKGPTLIECITYRWKGHVGPNLDIDKGLRTKEELDNWMKKCPIESFHKYILARNFFSESNFQEVSNDLDREIKGALIFARDSPYPNLTDVDCDIFKG